MSKLTYPTLSGQPRLRRFAMAALVLLVLALLVGLWASVRKSSQQAVMLATPKPLDVGLPASTPLPTRSDPIPTAAAHPCPTDPQDWQLQPVFPDDNYRKIEPACVLDSLARTVAWHFLTRSGYTVTEAAASLGFSSVPQGPYRESILGMTNTQGPLPIPLIYEQAHPDLRQWLVHPDGSSALVYSLRGCYRTATVTGNQVEDWGSGYPLICVLAMDQQGAWGIYQLGEHLYTASDTDGTVTRGFLLFGYDRNQGWLFIGQQDLWVEIEDPDGLASDREGYAPKVGVPLWDADWLQATYDLAIKPLPDDWQSRTDPAEIQAIVDQINREGTP